MATSTKQHLEAIFETWFMKKLSSTDAELKKMIYNKLVLKSTVNMAVSLKLRAEYSKGNLLFKVAGTGLGPCQTSIMELFSKIGAIH